MTQIAKAYVQLVPSAEGIGNKITSALGGEVGSSGEKAGKSFGSKFASIAKTVVAAAGIGKAVSSAISAGADYEQLVGGIETLFGAGGKSLEEYAKQQGKTVSQCEAEYNQLIASQGRMMDYANEAYSAAGMSANEYMETVTSFAASLKQSVGGDMMQLTSAANQAVIDMADNANKMGTDMERITDAYQGFAKQNYTMLDNLKLGYGGTKSEMERLLADASKISGVTYNLDNLADVYSAIHVIQTELGITGTTAEEAEKTFSGSMAAMKSAGQNVLAAMTSGENLTGALNGLSNSVRIFVVNNFVPMLGRLFTAIPDVLSGLSGTIAQLFNVGASKAPELVQYGAETVSKFVVGLTEQIPTIIGSAANFAVEIGKALISYDWASMASNMIGQIRDNISVFAAEFLGTDNIVGTIADGIAFRLPELVSKGGEIVVSLINGYLERKAEFLEKITGIIDELSGAIMIALPQLLQAGGDILMGIVSGISEYMPRIMEAFTEIMTALFEVVVENLPAILETGVSILMELIKGIAQALPDLLTAAAEMVTTLIGEIITHLPEILETGVKIALEIVTGILNCIPDVIDAALNFASTIWDNITKTDWKQLGKDCVNGIIGGLNSKLNDLINTAKTLASSAWGIFKSWLGISSPSKKFAQLGAYSVQGFVQGIESNTGLIENAMSGMSAIATGSLDTDRFNSAAGTQFGNTASSDIVDGISSGVYSAMMRASAANGSNGGTVVISINGKEFIRSVYNDLKAVGNEHGVSFVKA